MKIWLSRLFLLPAFLFLSCNLPLGAQPIDHRAIRPSERITRAVDERQTVTRRGNLHPLARREFDRGRVSADTRMDRMLLVLQPDAAQEQALAELLDGQQNPESPEYHRWLTPEDFGQRFGVSERDYQRVAAWLESHGFEVEAAPASRRTIIFSGTAGQVAETFHTEVHEYSVNGELHQANVSDPEIPVALEHVVGGVASLHDFHSQPMHRGARRAANIDPAFTSGGSHYMTPADFATIYNVAGLYSQSIDGTGQFIAVAGRSNFLMSDVITFRSQFGLSANNPKVLVTGTKPAILSGGEEMEALLDIEWSGAVAKKAQIRFVQSASTRTSDGVALASDYIVGQNLAPVMSLSFGLCEAAVGAAGNQFWKGLWQQAAAQGITVLVSSGDSGAAGCDGGSASSASYGAGVNGLCSSPYSVCVGGTEFVDTSNPNLYWTAGNASGTYASALSYIPESTWNDSGSAGGSGLWSTGGGASILYTKPAWQTGPGVPADGKRDVPDISLNSSVHDGYLVQMEGNLYASGGTSAAAPSMAGLMALVVQKTGVRQGNANPALYMLAAKQAAAGAAVFHDITSGNNSVPGLTGFSAGTGYDLATGLGSVDASVLVNHWNDIFIPSPNFQLSAAPVSLSITQGMSGNATLPVSIVGGFNSDVTLTLGALPTGLSGNLSATTLVAPGSGSVTLTLTATAQMTPGAYTVNVSATGSGSTQNVTLPVTILQNCSYSINPTQATPAASSGNFSAAVTAPNGCTWTAATSTIWVSVTGGASGNGNGTLNYSILQNNVTAARSGAITIAGVNFPITQAASTASVAIGSSAASFGYDGGAASIGVSTNPAGAAWVVSSSAQWITVTSGTLGVGNQTLTYVAATNMATASRTGTIVIGGNIFTVAQAGAPASCKYGFNISSTTSGGSAKGAISVIVAKGCKWTAASDSSWLTLTTATTGSGNGTVNYATTVNGTGSPRSGVLTVAGNPFSITQR